jgi:hypothetical protein
VNARDVTRCSDFADLHQNRIVSVVPEGYRLWSSVLIGPSVRGGFCPMSNFTFGDCAA